MLFAVVNQLLIDLVSNHIEAARNSKLGDFAKLITVPDRAGRVTGRIDEQRLGLFRHIRGQIARFGHIVLLALARNQHRHAARQTDHLRIGNPAGRGNNDLVAGIEQRA